MKFSIIVGDVYVNEAIKLGFKNNIIPVRNEKKINNKNINIIGPDSLKDIISKIF